MILVTEPTLLAPFVPPPRAEPAATAAFDRALAVHEITPAAVTERLSRRLRHLVGPGRRWSYAEISALTLIDVRTLKAYVAGTACPNLAKYKRLVAAIGAEVAMDLNRMLGWAPRADSRAPGVLDLAELGENLARAERLLTGMIGDDPGRRGPVARVAATQPAMRDDTLAQFQCKLSPRAITPQAIAGRLSFRLKRMVGPGRAWSVEALAQASLISRGVVDAYLAGTACPNLARYFRLERVLGQELGLEFALMLGWEPRFRRETPADPARLEALRAQLRATLDAIAGMAPVPSSALARD